MVTGAMQLQDEGVWQAEMLQLGVIIFCDVLTLEVAVWGAGGPTGTSRYQPREAFCLKHLFYL